MRRIAHEHVGVAHALHHVDAGAARAAPSRAGLGRRRAAQAERVMARTLSTPVTAPHRTASPRKTSPYQPPVDSNRPVALGAPMRRRAQLWLHLKPHNLYLYF